MEDIKDFKWTDELASDYVIDIFCKYKYGHSTANLENFKKEKSKENDIPKDWEIISFENQFGYLLLKAPDGTFGSDYAEESTLLSSSTHTIHSIKRNDGEVFTIGDKVEAREGKYCCWENIYRIISMSIQTGLLAFEIMNIQETNPTGSIWREIENIRKPKVPLFQTPTNESIYEGEEFYYMPKGTLHWINKSVKGLPQPPESFYYFKTKEDAIQFQLLNKPIEISAKDIIDYVTFHEGAFLHEKIINLFKTKINP